MYISKSQAIRDQEHARQAHRDKLDADARASNSADLVQSALNRMAAAASAEKIAAVAVSQLADDKALQDRAHAFKSVLV